MANSKNAGTDVTLGLDLGTGSIGWALIDEAERKIIATGVRVFPEGVDRDKGAEKSKNQTRREKRSIRRQIARRARRLSILREALVEAGLLPPESTEQDQLLGLDPYTLRMQALDRELEPFEIGRIFYHLAKRRGFLSNRKSDRQSGSDAGKVLGAIQELQEQMADSPARTLGEFLAGLSSTNQQVRNRYTHRDMYQHEFDMICDSQSRFHPSLLTDQIKYGTQGRKEYPDDPDRHRKRSSETHLQRYGLHGIIFFQRRMYWPKSVVGTCELEPKQKRCQRADRLAQKFRIVQDVNNLRYRDPETGLEQILSDTQRQSLIDYLMAGRTRNFDQIRKHLAKSGLPEDAEFNFERGRAKGMKGNETDAALSSKKCLGKSRWQSLDESERDRIVRILVDDRMTDNEMLDALEAMGQFTHEEIDNLMSVGLPEGRMSLSLVAMRKLLPYMEQGMQLMGTDKSNSALYAAGYLPIKTEEEGVNVELGRVPDGITNPIVRQALHETRKVVNAIVREYGKPDRIRVELAREAKKSFAERTELHFRNLKQRDAREEARQRLIEDAGMESPKRNDITKYLLWQESGGTCVYCGEGISVTQLRGGEANIDHILPRWRSLDDSYMNKVISHRSCNEEKSNMTPREWLEDSDPQRYRDVIARSRRLPYPKQGRFNEKDLVLQDFTNRHLTDTTYISTQVRSYLQSIGIPVETSKGTITAELRRYWGFNGILNIDNEDMKTREDHRHHAVDAAVVALSTHERLFRHAQLGSKLKNDEVAPPWDGIRDDLAESVNAINVSHKARRRISGALHEETFYGATQKEDEDYRLEPGGEERPWAKGWIEADNRFVRRKSVSEVKTPKHLAAIRDNAIRETLTAHLLARGADPAMPFPKGIFEGDNTPLMKSGRPVRKVRMVETMSTVRPAGKHRQFQFVQPGSNHHICYYETTDRKGNPKWNARVTTMWDAAQRVRLEGGEAINRSDCELGRFVMSLSIGESFMITDEDGEEKLCVVRKIRQDNRMYFKIHTDARETKSIEKENLVLSPDRLRHAKARKVLITPVGTIRSSSD